MAGISNKTDRFIKPLNAKLNPICHLLALLGAHHILHVSRIRVNYNVTGIKRRKARSNLERILVKIENSYYL